ncbi:hypothetical protein U9M48_014135 [Paspalum notatum var. saurae]|uniref:Uncharacterized protein n=1 Tax=Paspalum notatum var. saurae TaxID=547442 RepID=A0AAQ3WKF9_PASNO
MVLAYVSEDRESPPYFFTAVSSVYYGESKPINYKIRGICIYSIKVLLICFLTHASVLKGALELEKKKLDGTLATRIAHIDKVKTTCIGIEEEEEKERKKKDVLLE